MICELPALLLVYFNKMHIKDSDFNFLGQGISYSSTISSKLIIEILE